MVQPPGVQSVAQRLHHMRLAHHFRKVVGAIFAGKDEVRHAGILNCRAKPSERLCRAPKKAPCMTESQSV